MSIIAAWLLLGLSGVLIDYIPNSTGLNKALMTKSAAWILTAVCIAVVAGPIMFGGALGMAWGKWKYKDQP
jgi:hypothetical protein